MCLSRVLLSLFPLMMLTTLLLLPAPGSIILGINAFQVFFMQNNPNPFSSSSMLPIFLQILRFSNAVLNPWSQATLPEEQVSCSLSTWTCCKVPLGYQYAEQNTGRRAHTNTSFALQTRQASFLTFPSAATTAGANSMPNISRIAYTILLAYFVSRST